MFFTVNFALFPGPPLQKKSDLLCLGVGQP